MSPYVPVVADLLRTRENRIIAVRDTANLTEAAAILSRNRIGILVVIDAADAFRGILSERDIVRTFATAGAEAARIKVDEVATHTIRACDPARPLNSVLESMRSGGFRHMPVIENGQIRGVISAGDILSHFVANPPQPLRPVA